MNNSTNNNDAHSNNIQSESREETEYEIAQRNLEDFVDDLPLQVERIDRPLLESKADMSPHRAATIEQACVNYIRQSASRFEELRKMLDCPGEVCSTKLERHVLHVEKTRLVARLKRRLLDGITEKYAWLVAECDRQKQRHGLEDDPGDYVFRGRPLRELDNDYLKQLLDQWSVRKAFRNRIERLLAERSAIQSESHAD